MLQGLLVCLGVALGQECGRSSLRELHRGEPGEVGEGHYPSACTLATEINGLKVFMGGASLISRNQLVTLATLVSGVQGEEDTCTSSTTANLMVVCGTVDLQAEHGEEVQVRKVARVLIHPNYKARSLANDIAVLVLEEPVDFTESVAQACLPRPGNGLAAGTRCVAVGHGRDGPDEGRIYNKILHQVNLPLWRSDDCEETLNKRHFTPEHDIGWRIHSSHLCAGGEEDRDTCTGDGGGPLLCAKGTTAKETADDIDELFKDEVPEDNVVDDEELFSVDLRGVSGGGVTLVQAGITAWGIGCGRAGIPAVYTDLASAACWLDQVTSCFPAEEVTAGLVNLRSGARPASARGLTEKECGAWLEDRGLEGACGCRQTLLKERPAVTNFDLRGNSDA